MAGATPANVHRLVYTQSLSTFIVGSALGCLVSLAGAKFVRSVLYGVTPSLPGVYAVVIGMVAPVALVAT
jgi:hypothetical protein